MLRKILLITWDVISTLLFVLALVIKNYDFQMAIIMMLVIPNVIALCMAISSKSSKSTRWLTLCLIGLQIAVFWGGTLRARIGSQHTEIDRTNPILFVTKTQYHGSSVYTYETKVFYCNGAVQMINDVQTDYIDHAFWVRTGDIVYDLEWDASVENMTGEVSFDLEKHTCMSNGYVQYEISEIDWSLLEKVVKQLNPDGDKQIVTFYSHV